jgi:hypothetical protein
MNYILEKREFVINENNTAQRRIISTLGSLFKTVPELWINQTLHGDIDFSVIRELGFNTINKIFLKKGEITSITGIPEGIIEFYCIDNYLFEIDNLPKSLKELNLDMNYIERIDFKDTPNLKKVILSHNKLVEIENLPPSLEELYLNYNDIKELDLQHLTQLRVLHVKNNKSIILKNIPPSLINLEMDNDPFQPVNLIPTEENKEDENEEDTAENEIEYREALNEYFKMKQLYEEKTFKAKSEAYNRGKTKNEKKRLVLQVKPKCIHCQRPVGTLFSLKDNKYIAICGDKREPCPLNIKIYKGIMMNFEEVLYLFKDEVEKLKDTIIKQKLDTIFNYLSEKESIEQFKKNITQYNYQSSEYSELLDKYNEYYKNPVSKEMILKKTDDIYRLIGAIGELLEEYNRTNNKEILKRIVEIETQELYPETHNLRMLKYKIMEVFFQDKEKKDILFQKTIGLGDYDYSVGEVPRVIKFRK